MPKANKRGFTLAEVVIAMAVVVLVSFSAAAAIRLSVSSTSRDFDYELARVSVKNALEYYKYDETELEPYLTGEGYMLDGAEYVCSYGEYNVRLTLSDDFSAVVIDDHGNIKLEITDYAKGG